MNTALKSYPTYAKQLEDRRWLEKRAEVLKHYGCACNRCADEKEPLHVHHRFYRPKVGPWDYPLDAYEVLCSSCHRWEHQCRKLRLSQVSQTFEMLSAAYIRAGKLNRYQMKLWLFLRAHMAATVANLVPANA